MSANTNPIYSLTPNVGEVKITQSSALVRSDGGATNAIGTDHFLTFTSGVNGSFIQRIRFIPVSSAAAVNSVATTLRVFMSTVNSGIPTPSNTYLLAEISVPIISTSNSTNAVSYYEIPLNIAMPANQYILVSQHIAQTANQSWQAMVFGGDY
jgi:hypothetical protein